MKTMKPQVFLGGSCNPTTWRADIAIPRLSAAGIEFYNPQQDGWTPEMAVAEGEAKGESEVILFVLDSQTRAVASMVEATEYISTGRKVVLVVQNIADGTVVADKNGNQTVTGRELQDLNRGRAYVLELTKRHPNATVCQNVEEAVDACAEILAAATK